MKCDAARELIPLCVGHEISPEEEETVYRHLSSCPDCAHEMKEYRLIFSTMSQLREGRAPQGTWQTMWGNIREATVGKPRVIRFAFDDLLRVAAVALIGIGIGFFAVLLTSDSPAPEPATNVAKIDSEPLDAGSIPVNKAPEAAPTERRRYFFNNMRRRPGQGEERFYLPSVESVLPTKGEVRF